MTDERRRARSRSRLLFVVTALVATTALSSCDGLLPGSCKQEPPDPSITVPDSFVVRFETSRGAFDVMARKAWSPIGVDALLQARTGAPLRRRSLLSRRDQGLRRAVRPLRQAGRERGVAEALHRRRAGEASERHAARSRSRAAAPGRARCSCSSTSPTTHRSTQPTPSAFRRSREVVAGLELVDSLYGGYGERAPRSGSYFGHEGPSQDSIMSQGNAYLARWPKLDSSKTARVVRAWPQK